MPVDQVKIAGRRTPGGEVTLNEFRFESPQMRLLGKGSISPGADQPLMNRPLVLSLELAAKDELAVILGGMSLLEKKPGADGYRTMRQRFMLGGRAGAPDTAPLYDLLARAVGGSKGTWGFLMRKVQAEITKKQPSAAKARANERPVLRSFGAQAPAPVGLDSTGLERQRSARRKQG